MKRIITLKWENACGECGLHLEVGQQAEYEKTTGIFCIGHFPVEPESIRHFRLIKAERKAAKYEEWADKRREKASALMQRNEPYRGDIAFNTQPGHIPERARVIARTEKAWEHSSIANEFEQKAESLRHVQVAGDAERRRQAKRDSVDAWVKPGIMVNTVVFGVCEVLKVNTKTVKVKGRFGNFNVEKSFLEKVA